MKFMDSILKKLARFQIKHIKLIVVIGILITLVFLMGFFSIQMQTDIMEEMPQDLPIFVLDDKVSASFGGEDVVVVITQFDTTKDDLTGLRDIRNPATITFVQELEKKLLKESDVDSVISINTYLQDTELLSNAQVKYFLKMVPDANRFFSDDYTSSIMYITADVGSSQEKVNELVDTIENDIDLTSKVPGTNNYVTGNPILISTVGELMLSDSMITIAVALLAITLLLFVLKKSFLKAIIIMIPLVIGLIWTIGFLGYAHIPITLATAGLGAMILGLGVEYSIFMFTRYLEERDKGFSQEKSLNIALPSVAHAIMGSGITTLIGFLSLTLSTIPMLQKLGLTLAIGIVSILIVTLVFYPMLFISFENWHLKQVSEKRKNIFTNK